MAIRELYAIFGFQWDKAQLAGLNQAIGASQAKVQHLAGQFNRAGRAVQNGLFPAVQKTPAVLGASAMAAAQTGKSIGGLAGKFGEWSKGADRAAKSVAGIGPAAKQSAGMLGTLGGAFLGFFAVGKIKDFLSHEFKHARDVRRMARTAGSTVAEIQPVMSFAEMTGLDEQVLKMGLRGVGNALGTIKVKGKGAAQDFLRGLNVETETLLNQNTAQAFMTLSKAIAGVDDPLVRAATATKLFGRAGIAMLPALAGGSEEIAERIKLAEEMGAVYTEEFADQAAAVSRAMTIAKHSWHRAYVELLTGLVPIMKASAGYIRKFADGLHHAAVKSKAFHASIYRMAGFAIFLKLWHAIGGASGALSKLWGILRRFAGPLLRFFSWALILEDIMVFLRGGESLLGRLLDRLFGAGTAVAVLAALRGGFKQAAEWILHAWHAVLAWLAAIGVDHKQAAAIAVLALMAIGTGLGGVAANLAVVIAKFALMAVQAVANAATTAGAIGTITTAALAAGAAIAAMWVAKDQWDKLQKETEAEGGVWNAFQKAGGFGGLVDFATGKAPTDNGFVSRYGSPPPVAPGAPGGAGRTVTVVDQSTHSVQVTGVPTPAKVAAAVAPVVQKAGAENRAAVAAALGVQP